MAKRSVVRPQEPKNQPSHSYLEFCRDVCRNEFTILPYYFSQNMHQIIEYTSELLLSFFLKDSALLLSYLLNYSPITEGTFIIETEK